MQAQKEDTINTINGVDKSYPSHLSYLAGLRLPFRGKTRAGYTTSKGHGTPKAKRKQAAASRHRNRGK